MCAVELLLQRSISKPIDEASISDEVGVINKDITLVNLSIASDVQLRCHDAIKDAEGSIQQK
jgi:hypothetical protein